MPESKRYVISQTREVVVSAANETDAISLGNSAFNRITKNINDPALSGYIDGNVEIIDVNVHRFK